MARALAGDHLSLRQIDGRSGTGGGKWKIDVTACKNAYFLSPSAPRTQYSSPVTRSLFISHSSVMIWTHHRLVKVTFVRKLLKCYNLI